MDDDDGVWRLELESVPVGDLLEHCLYGILPRETDRFVEKALSKEGLPEGLRRFLEDFADGEFDGHDASESFSGLLLAVALATRKGAEEGPDIVTATLAVAGVAGVNAMWTDFVAEPRNARFAEDRPAGELVAEALHLAGLLEAGIPIVAKGVRDGTLTEESFDGLIESAVMSLYAKTAAS